MQRANPALAPWMLRYPHDCALFPKQVHQDAEHGSKHRGLQMILK